MDWVISIFNFLVGTGTNDLIVSLVLKNIILLGLIVKLTPWTWDNEFVDGIKGRFGKNPDRNK